MKEDSYFFYNLTYSISNQVNLTIPESGGVVNPILPCVAMLMVLGALLFTERRRKTVPAKL